MHHLPITETSHVAVARRSATHIARKLGFNDTETGKVALLATEAATNLVKHAVHGQLLLQQLPDSNGIELLALDTGPGMRNVSQCLRDGYSTAGSSGTGLGAITRLSTLWDIYSIYGVGTALLMRFFPATTPTAPLSHSLLNTLDSKPTRGKKNGALDVGGICVSMPREDVCGDAWTSVQQASRSLIMVADGLGHGRQAAEAAYAAVRTVHDYPTEHPAALLERMHGALRHTRGAAVAVAEVNLDRQELTFAGVGNIAAALLIEHKMQYLPSHNGIVGYHMRPARALTYPWPDNALLLLYSDGLVTRWNFAPYPGLLVRQPSLIAGVLYRDYARGRDDVAVVVAK